ncbi:MAG: hypothetical protein JW712_11425 [Dehalococcoidales bacterium]|nr:hypothetical protein [Dehalococcoidales bacterium]
MTSEIHENHTPENPYISFVIVGRNDNYGGNFLDRLQVYINVLHALAVKYRLPSEIIVVDWNPPHENLHLSEAIRIPERGAAEGVYLRFIEVPPEVHRTFLNSEKMMLYEYAGKNVGIRRALGSYIVATNPDIIFSETLVKYIAARKLSTDSFYRSTRIDVKTPVPDNASLEDILNYCRHNIIKINGYTHTYNPGLFSRFNPIQMYYHLRLLMKYHPYAKPFTNAAGDFLMMHKDKWFALHGYPEISGVDKDGLHHSDSFMVHTALFYGLKQVGLKSPIYHQEHGMNLSSRPYSPEVNAIRHKLLNEHKPIIFNDDNWGLPDYQLVDKVIEKR